MSDDRPQPPAGVKRELRQEACFGCCACGNPLLQYHHIIPYAVEAHFRPRDMMALCPNHHVEANELVLDEAQQRALKASPVNCNQGFAAGQLAVRQRNTELEIGAHIFAANAGDLIRVDGDALLTTRISAEGSLLLNVRLYDDQDELLAEVIDNEWLSYDPLPWDIEFRFRELTIRSAPRQISLSIDCRAEPVSIRGSLWRKGRNLRIDPKGLHVDQAHFVGGGRVEGFVIELDASTAGTTGFRLAPQIAPQYPGHNQPRPASHTKRAKPARRKAPKTFHKTKRKRRGK